LDSLTGLFAAGLAPQSTADPYGQRRAAFGIVQIVVNKAIDADLASAVALAAELLPIPVSDETRAQVLEFIAGRLRSWLEDQDWRHDVVEAVLAEQSANPHRALVGIRELSEWVQRPDWEQILDGFARCVRITRGETTRYVMKPDLLVEPEEKALWDAYQTAAARLMKTGNVDEFLTAFEPMLHAVTSFFDKVLVMAEDPVLRQNRLGLLQAISAMQRGRADLSYLSGF
jgi:glycyl-tRNA synthetase